MTRWLTRARGYGLLGALLLCLVAPRLSAKPAVDVEAFPLLGPSTPAWDGWFTVAVRLTNLSAQPETGMVELVASFPYASDSPSNVTRASFSLGAKEDAMLELPTHGFYLVPPALELRLLDASGSVVSKVDVPDPIAAAPLLFDFSVPSRLVPVLRARAVPVATLRSGRRVEGLPLAVSMPRQHPLTGRPLVPETAAGYGPATLVVSSSAKLAALSASELDALGNWVLAGGALAVVVTRPEDLRGTALKAFLGGEARAAEVPDSLRRERVFFVPPDPTTAPSGPPGTQTPRLLRQQVAPSAEVAARLAHFAGGNLRDSPWGAAASYGLGEVHLLAFDATAEPFVGDPWVQLLLIDLVRHAWSRTEHIALQHGRAALNEPSLEPIRRELDPNERTRWTIAVSAVLLLLYSLVAGPWNFYRASRRGRPLIALLYLPLYAAAAMLSIIAVGIAGRGVEGKSRRLSLIEAGAGATRGSVVRFRGFFAASSDELRVRPSERRNVLDVAGDLADTSAVLTLDRDGIRLEKVRARPWQTLVVREDGFLPLGGGVSVLTNARGEIEIRNRLARDLVAVVVKAPGRDAVYFPRIKDGQSVTFAGARTLNGAIGRPMAPGMDVSLGAELFGPAVDEAAPGAGSAWQALESAQSVADWWPDDVPVLLAEVAGAEGKATDSGLKVDAERLLIRVVGYGGVL